MPNNRFLHLLNIHPKYMHLKRHMHHFHQSANHKAHGEGLVHRTHHRKLHHLMGSGRGPNSDYVPPRKDFVPPQIPRELLGDGMSHKFRRPAPLKFKL